MNTVRCPYASKVGSKTQNGRFLCKIALHLKKVCYKVSLCEYCQRQSRKAFTGLSIHAKMVHEGRPLIRKNLAETDQSSSKTLISYQYLLVAPQP